MRGFYRRLSTASILAVAIFALVVVSAHLAVGQATKGTLRGTVIDPNGGVVAGATVTAQNQGTGTSTQTISNGEGIYVLPDLLPGQYTVTVETTAGFSKKA